ncbi:LmbE-like protein [Xylariaceae sp. FL0804]|nr:LmbE-like protein [Xylariaceae sp. FL0804]
MSALDGLRSLVGQMTLESLFSPATLLSLAVLLPLLYLYTSSVAAARMPSLRNARICLLIAHPDDEAMFFAPALLALTRPEAGNHVKILCLSTGDAAGLGETRRRELVRSALLLGLRAEDDVFVVDRPDDFPDAMDAHWDTAKISSLLCSAFAPHLSSSASSSSDSSGGRKKNNNSSSSSGHNRPADAEPPTALIDALVTFDARGVSAHPNHTSLYHGARRFVGSLLAGKPGWASPVDLYTLTTVPRARKYLSFLDVFATLAGLVLAGPRARKASGRGNPGALVALSGFWGREGYGAARRAMTRAHVSQMVWFRWGWIALSRYMFINDLRLEKVT